MNIRFLKKFRKKAKRRYKVVCTEYVPQLDTYQYVIFDRDRNLSPYSYLTGDTYKRAISGLTCIRRDYVIRLCREKKAKINVFKENSLIKKL